MYAQKTYPGRRDDDHDYDVDVSSDHDDNNHDDWSKTMVMLAVFRKVVLKVIFILYKYLLTKPTVLKVSTGID